MTEKTAMKFLGNALASEKNPYLLRHASNLVNWHAWNKEAFGKAQEQDKPIFLSIGFSSCRWCRVMERECFCDAELAGLINDTCISIMVDFEERPDLGALFMDICQIQNGSGGWPLNLFLTPDGKPFFAATWLPKRTQGRMPGLADIIPRVKWLWLMQREDVLRGAKSLTDTLAAKSMFVHGSRFGSYQIQSALKELKNLFDGTWGGFGFAPKQLDAAKLLFLLEHSRSSAEPEKSETFLMVNKTLRKMWSGGVHDHLGGGFACSAIDERWIVPNFEKMLYDQALLLRAAVMSYEISGDDFYKKLAEDIVGCVMRVFSSQESCFVTSVGADSDNGEGSYYLWTEEEIRALLPSADFGIFSAACAILPNGNFRHDLTRLQTGENILYEAATVSELARRYMLKGSEVAKRLENCKRLLLEARNRRAMPLVDDKILMDLNGLMIGSLAYAGRVFEKKEWILSAERAALFLQKVLVDPKGNWRRRYRVKEAAINALPADYASLLWGVMELYESAASEKQKKDWLRYALTLASKLEENYWDAEHGGFFLMHSSEEHAFLRYKDGKDNTMPSPNALAVMALTLLWHASEDEKYLDMIKGIASCFARVAYINPLEHLSLSTAMLRFENIKLENAKQNIEKDKELKELKKHKTEDENNRKI